MIYKHRITFRKMTAPGKYNPATGLTSAPTFEDVTLPCEIGPVSAERTLRLFGSITLRANIVRLQRQFTGAYAEVKVNGKPYEVLRQIDHDGGSGFTGIYIKEKVS